MDESPSSSLDIQLCLSPVTTFRIPSAPLVLPHEKHSYLIVFPVLQLASSSTKQQAKRMQNEKKRGKRFAAEEGICTSIGPIVGPDGFGAWPWPI